MPELDRTTLLDLWRRMVRIRRFEERVHRETEDGRTEGYTHTAHGEEATAVGVIALLREDDWFTSTYRNHHHAIARDIPLEAIAGELLGKVTGVCGGKGGSMHAADQDAGMIGGMGIVAAGLPIAAGAAFAARRLGQDRVAVSFFGDGAVHQGAWHEALDFAALLSCPVIFVCENNLYSVYTPLHERQPERPITDVARAHDIKALHCDGNDLERVLQVATEAVERARSGYGPTFLLLDTYRWREHCGPNFDNTLGYRSEAEYENWKLRCPLQRLRARLVDVSILTTSHEDSMRATIAAEIEDARAFARSAPLPEPRDASQYVYA
jgi:pyruvate dehydrogenase E1 component alpha subunit